MPYFSPLVVSWFPDLHGSCVFCWILHVWRGSRLFQPLQNGVSGESCSPVSTGRDSGWARGRGPWGAGHTRGLQVGRTGTGLHMGLDVYFPHGSTLESRGSLLVLLCAMLGERWCGWSEIVLTLFNHLYSFHASQGGYNLSSGFQSSLKGIFTCGWLIKLAFLCRDKAWDLLLLHLADVTLEFAF